jgi:phosphate-selective porin OprO/OprP
MPLIAAGDPPRRLAAALLIALAAALPASAAAGQSTQPAPRVRVRWTTHPRIDIGDLRLDVRARLTADVRRSDAPFDEDELDRTVDIARRRIGLEGEFGSYVSFQIERELGDDLDPWRDVYVNYGQFEAVEVRYGKFKVPFGLDENTSSTNLDFAYRSLISSHLAPGRDIGVMVHGRLLDRVVNYELGRFDEDGDNALSRNPVRVTGSGLVAWRLGVQPLRRIESPYTDLQIALSRSTSDVPEGFPALQGDAVLGARIFEADFWVKGQRRRDGLEIRWRPGPASVKFERIRLTNERLGQGVEEEDLAPYEAEGWYLSGTFAVTGDVKADGLDNPRRPLFQGGVGAIEVAARVERITFGTTGTTEASTSPRAETYLGNSNRVVTAGVNWYLNRWIKVQFNVIRETMSDPAQGPLPGQPSFWSRVFRFQIQM